LFVSSYIVLNVYLVSGDLLPWMEDDPVSFTASSGSVSTQSENMEIGSFILMFPGIL
jgi:hypothetical protein